MPEKHKSAWKILVSSIGEQPSFDGVSLSDLDIAFSRSPLEIRREAGACFEFVEIPWREQEKKDFREKRARQYSERQRVMDCLAELPTKYPNRVQELKQMKGLLPTETLIARNVDGKDLLRAFRQARGEEPAQSPKTDSAATTLMRPQTYGTGSSPTSSYERVRSGVGNIFTIALAGLVLLLAWSVLKKPIKTVLDRMGGS